jgi:hypothetical protein
VDGADDRMNWRPGVCTPADKPLSDAVEQLADVDARAPSASDDVDGDGSHMNTPAGRGAGARGRSRGETWAGDSARKDELLEFRFGGRACARLVVRRTERGRREHALAREHARGRRARARARAGAGAGSEAESDATDANGEPGVERMRRWKRRGRGGSAHAASAAAPSSSLAATTASKPPPRLYARPTRVALSSTRTSRSAPPSASASGAGRRASCDTSSARVSSTARAVDRPQSSEPQRWPTRLRRGPNAASGGETSRGAGVAGASGAGNGHRRGLGTKKGACGGDRAWAVSETAPKPVAVERAPAAVRCADGTSSGGSAPYHDGRWADDRAEDAHHVCAKGRARRPSTQGECRAGKVQRVGQGAVDRGGKQDHKATLW